MWTINYRNIQIFSRLGNITNHHVCIYHLYIYLRTLTVYSLIPIT